MKNFIAKKQAAWTEHHAKFDCPHSTYEIRMRVIKGGAVQYVYQCQVCGEPRNQPIARVKALELSSGVEPPPFNPSIVEAWELAKTNSANSIKEEFNRKAFFSDYDTYLQSKAWANLRQQVINRAANSCEGCGQKTPTEVHHLSYEHVGKEFLFELVAVCHDCHERLHNEEKSE